MGHEFVVLRNMANQRMSSTDALKGKPEGDQVSLRFSYSKHELPNC